MIRTLVINLARSENRRQAIRSKLEDLGMPFEFWKAVDGEAITPQQMALYSSRAAFKEHGRELHRNEIGCILSHIGIWTDLIEQNDDEVLVIEDDMLIDADFPALVESRDWIPADARVVNFAWDMANPVNLRPITPARSLCRFDRDVMRTGGYIMRKAAAEALLENAFPIRMPVDSLAGHEAFVGGPIYGVSPRPIRWDEALPTETWTDSTMESFANSSRKSVRGLTFRILSRLFR